MAALLPPGARIPPTPPPIPAFSATLFLDQATRENGCWWTMPGHHLAGPFDLGAADPEALYARARPLELAPGDTLFLAATAPRASQGNSSPRTWQAFQMLYQAVGADPAPAGLQPPGASPGR
ncbi:MAG: phytanoyl-CoA dioxygenase family protein [Candidatus Handelsmanbacteria bacterium]|nr:phytanoyl-CoA dioxygenase family protein [Candidatus Handelsmanbacteria bacterium]